MLPLRCFTLALLLALLPASLGAQQQVRFAIGGFGGLYVPTTDLVSEIDQEIGVFEFGQATGFNFGGRLAIWPSDRFGIEGELAFVLSDTEVQILPINGGQLTDEQIDATVALASLTLVYSVIKPAFEPFEVFISGGVGVVSRSGDLWDDLEALGFDDPTDIAGILGLGGKYGVAPGVWLRADLRDYLSSFKLVDGLDSKLQNDLLINVGLELSFPR